MFNQIRFSLEILGLIFHYLFHSPDSLSISLSTEEDPVRKNLLTRKLSLVFLQLYPILSNVATSVTD